MIKPVFYIIFLVCCFKSYSQQNLVQNGSFEEYYSCPTGNDLNNGQLEKCKYWWKPTMGTSDYFNRCNNGVVSVPNNFWGYQEPFDGDGYVGLVPLEWNLSSGHVYSYEYIQTKLIKPLIMCNKYRFKMFVSFANFSKYCYTKLGAMISKDSIVSNTSNSLIVSDVSILVHSTNQLCDTMDWMEVSGNFTSNGNEQYLSIGFFFDSYKNDTLFFQNQTFFPEVGFGYYYIDSISIVEIGKDESCYIIIPNVFTPNDDGINDRWEFISPVEGNVQILNRWGQTVYNHFGINFSWNGEDLTDGVYFFKFVANETIKTGFIHLVR